MTIEAVNTPAEQFAQDWLLIADNNDSATYERIKYACRMSATAYDLAKVLEDEWEELTVRVRELVTASVHPKRNDIFAPIADWLVDAILANWGIEPFMIIARRLKARQAEDEAYRATQA